MRCVRLAVAAVALAVSPALAVYINPLPYNNRFDLGREIDAATYPFMGRWGDNSGPGDTFAGRCSAIAIATTRRPAKTFVLTAAHCAAGLEDGRAWHFQVGGDGVAIEVDEVHSHPNYAERKRNDIAVAVSSSTPEGLKAIGLPGKSFQLPRTFFAAGFGTTGFDGQANSGAGSRRRIFAEISAIDDGRDEFTMPRGGTGANTPDGIDPVRHLCRGDSGGPSLTLDGTLIGVHSTAGGGNMYMEGGKTVSRCDGSQLRATASSLTRQQNRLFIGSYVLIDRLGLNLQPLGGFVDAFEPDPAFADSYAFGAAGLAPGWRPLALGQFVAHPDFPDPIGENAAGWEYFNAIGTTSDPARGIGGRFDDPDGDPGQGLPDLFTDGRSSQGATVAFGGPSIIYRDFIVMGGARLRLDVDVRWNSLDLAADLGLLLPDGEVVWSGLARSSLGDIDQWRMISLEADLERFSASQVVRALMLVSSGPTTRCDVDANGVIDRNDIAGLFGVRNTRAGIDDPRDVDRDGTITVHDARSCTLRCTNPRCTP